ncbi:crotonyl-CoA carboxylase/reductase [Streptomyces sp. NPDC048441]|uniref:crotonyl-CoA carboxylase/reductase n=1 Tax=Streptomyces sp. NPDC048441 TaxID=3365552 RepID=UPI00370FE313
MQQIMDALESGAAGAAGAALAELEIPTRYRAAVVRRGDVGIFDGVNSEDRDPARSLRVEEVPTPALAPDEVLIAVMASSINYNTVWSSIFAPMPTFPFLARLGRETEWGARHDLDHHVIGSDAAGVVLRTGSLVHSHRVGDRVVVHGAYADAQDPEGHDDGMLGANLRAWGYETNFGGLGELAVAKASQVMPKPAHLSWEEAAVNGVCNSTAYRMLVSERGARMKQGDIVLIWGATGGLGSYALQYVRRAGGIPVCVASSPAKVEMLRAMGVEAVIDRSAADYRFWSDPHTQDPKEWRRFGKDVRALVGDDPHIVFEHPGRETMGASVYVARRGGTVVTCAATTGHMIEYDQRHLWMKLKTIKASHIANFAEAMRANDLIAQGAIQPTLTETYALDDIAAATTRVHRNEHTGKIAVRCLAPHEGLGIEEPERRREIGEDQISAFRRASSGVGSATALG